MVFINQENEIKSPQKCCDIILLLFLNLLIYYKIKIKIKIAQFNVFDIIK